jgi:hypothetical protein
MGSILPRAVYPSRRGLGVSHVVVAYCGHFAWDICLLPMATTPHIGLDCAHAQVL